MNFYKEERIGLELPDTLLSEEETFNLIDLAQSGDIEARNKLIEYNMKLALKITYNYKLDALEYLKEITTGLINAIENYDIKRDVKFSTFMGKCVKNEILKVLDQRKRQRKNESLNRLTVLTDIDLEKIFTIEATDCFANYEDDIAERVSNEEIYQIVRECLNGFNPLPKSRLELYFGIGHDRQYSQTEIAKMEGVSRQAVSQSVISSLEVIKTKLVSYGVTEQVFRDDFGYVYK